MLSCYQQAKAKMMVNTAYTKLDSLPYLERGRGADGKNANHCRPKI